VLTARLIRTLSRVAATAVRKDGRAAEGLSRSADRRLGGRDTRDREAEGRAADVVEARAVKDRIKSEACHLRDQCLEVALLEREQLIQGGGGYRLRDRERASRRAL
jgi:hypothetical protein